MLGEARHHDRDLDAGAAQLGADGLREPDHAVLGGAVGGEAGTPARPASDAMLTMWPVPRGRIRRIASCVPWMTACRLISSWRVMLASASSSSGVTGMIPALLIEDVDRAEPPLDLVEERGEAGAVGDVEGEADRAVAELGGGGLGGARRRGRRSRRRAPSRSERAAVSACPIRGPAP